MNSFLNFIFHIFSFIIIYNILSYINFDEKVFFFLTPTNSGTSPEIKIKDILKAEGSSKPLKLTKPEIGRRTWALLHSMANTFPENATEEDKNIMKKFMYGLARSYPCKVCGGHLIKMLNKKGINMNTRKDFVNYICHIHNIVNKVLNKTEFDCEKAYDIWNGNYQCNINKNS